MMGRKARACLIIALWQLCVTVCGRLDPNEGDVVGYVDRMRAKYTAKWGVQMTGMNDQTRSKGAKVLTVLCQPGRRILCIRMLFLAKKGRIMQQKRRIFKYLRRNGLALLLVLLMGADSITSHALGIAGKPDQIPVGEESSSGMSGIPEEFQSFLDEAGTMAPEPGSVAPEGFTSGTKMDLPMEEDFPDAAETPAEVQAFLDAVAALPSADKVNAENAEAIGNQVNALLDMWEALDESLSGREDVSAALEKVYAVYEAVLAAEEIEEAVHFLESIPGYTPADRFYYNGKEVAQLYVGTYANNPVYSYTNPATAIVIKVGETGYDQRLYTKSATCYCGNVLVEETPDAETAEYQAGNPVDLEWREGLGSAENPVSKTLYAVWEKDDENQDTTYTVIREYYVDYVDEENPGEKVARVTSAKTSGIVGEEIDGAVLASNNPNWSKYTIDGETFDFTYKDSNPEKLVLVKDETENVITLKYVIKKEPEPIQTPTPAPTEEPTPTEAPTPTEEPTPTEAPTPTEEPTPTEAPTPSETPTPTEAPTPTEEPMPTEVPAPTEEPTPTEAPTTPPVTPTETPEPPTPTATPEVPTPPAPQEPEPPAEPEEPEPPTPPTPPTRVIEVVPEVPEVVTPDGPDTLVVIPDEDVARAVVYERVVNPVTEETTYELNEEIPVLEEVPETVTIDSPDTVIILDEEVPQAYVKTQDPVTDDFVYIPEEEVPLASIGTPQTGDATGNHWMMLFMMSLGGMIFLLPDVIHRKKNR